MKIRPISYIVLSLSLLLSACSDSTYGSGDGYTVPVAYGRIISVLQNSSVEIQLQADDPDGDLLQYYILDSPWRGTLQKINISRCLYTPEKNYTGDDSFTFQVHDGLNQSNTATITLRVQPFNYSPAVDSMTCSIEEGGTIEIKLNATDMDDDPVSFEIVEPPDGEMWSLDGDTVTYTQGPGFYSSDSFKYRAHDLNSDGTIKSDSLLATVTITVNQAVTGNTAPQLTGISPDPVVTDEEVPVDFIIQAYDAEGDTLTLAEPLEMQGGEITGIERTGSSFRCTFSPDVDLGGEVSFTMTLSDGRETTDVPVTVTVNAVNDPPVVDDPVVFTLSRETGSPQPFNLPGRDVDGDALVYTVPVDSQQGSLVPPAHGILSQPQGITSPVCTYEFTGDGDETEDSFTYTVSDGTDTIPVTVSIYLTEEGTWYVDDTSGSDDNDGRTVYRKFKTIQKALSVAVSGDRIKVDEGEYSPFNEDDTPLVIKSGITVEGTDGFGGSTTIHIQSGRNGYLVLTESVKLEKLDFTGADSQAEGGCLRVIGIGNTIQDCSFENNRSMSGGAVSLAEGSYLKLTECNFLDNSALDIGGAIQAAKDSTLIITTCTFESNNSDNLGGAICAMGTCIVTDTVFSDNTARNGGAVYLSPPDDSSSISMQDCGFTGNAAAGDGGAVYLYRAGTISGCEFTSNTAAQGGSLYCDGTLSATNPSFTVEDCRFSDNKSTGHGGAVYLYHGLCRLIGVVFSGNQADWLSAGTGDGGALYAALYSRVDLLNCLVYNNAAGRGGAAFFTGNSQTRIVNCTLAYNTATPGPSLYMEGGYATVRNSILWNLPADPENGPVDTNAADAADLCDVTWSCVQYGFTGEGNSAADPLFADSDNDNYHLVEKREIDDTTYYSPCIDKADNGDLDDIYSGLCSLLSERTTTGVLPDLMADDMGYHYRLIP